MIVARLEISPFALLRLRSATVKTRPFAAGTYVVEINLATVAPNRIEITLTLG